MEDIILEFLNNHKNKYVSLIEIEKALPGNVDYLDFSNAMNRLIDMEVLSMVKKHGTNNREIPLPNTYRINKVYFRKDLIDEIASYQLKLDSNINLQSYFSLSEKTWKKDLPYIKKIDIYLKKEGLPVEEKTAQERSYQILGDEKWIDEGGGREIVNRVGLLEDLKIISVPDPLMFAINRNKITNTQQHIHLIVENKATFYALMDDIENTNFTSLVYGAGWKALGGISIFEKQIGLAYKDNKIYYFGDLDFEGISIWYGLNRKKPIALCTEFYQHLIKKPCSYGKSNQVPNYEAIDSFLSNFDALSRADIMNTLQNGGYYPQEGLDKTELETIWRNIR